MGRHVSWEGDYSRAEQMESLSVISKDPRKAGRMVVASVRCSEQQLDMRKEYYGRLTSWLANRTSRGL
jgi:hypothetical protein